MQPSLTHVTVLLQPSVTGVPQGMPKQIGFDEQPHPFGPAPPPPQVLGDWHVLSHVIVAPQLVIAGPHALVAHVTWLDSSLHLQNPSLQSSPLLHGVHRAISEHP